jgi:hypothetical protein
LVSITELTSVTGPFGLKIERDLHFSPKKRCQHMPAKHRPLSRIKA